MLVKTSNPSSKDFQDLFSVKLENVPNTVTEIEQTSLKLERNYIQMAKLVKDWGKDLKKFSEFHNLGAVVGATHPNELKSVRQILTSSFILMPGYGAQGAEAKDVKYGFLKSTMGGIVNSSRGIMFAYKNRKFPPEKFGEAARKEVLEMNQKINKELGI